MDQNRDSRLQPPADVVRCRRPLDPAHGPTSVAPQAEFRAAVVETVTMVMNKGREIRWIVVTPHAGGALMISRSLLHPNWTPPSHL
jgi:hypothetical protein